MSNDRKPTTPKERLRAALTPAAREERLLRGEYERQRRTTAIERAFGKLNNTTEEKDDA